jgi:hypothetical protein
MSNSVFTYVVLLDQHSELLLLENIATAMLLHQQMAQHIDHTEWGGEPDRRGSYTSCHADFYFSSAEIAVELISELISNNEI